LWEHAGAGTAQRYVRLAQTRRTARTWQLNTGAAAMRTPWGPGVSIPTDNGAEIEALAGSIPNFAAWEQNEPYTIALLIKGRSGGASTKHLYRSGSSSTGNHILWLASGTTPNLRHEASGGVSITLSVAIVKDTPNSPQSSIPRTCATLSGLSGDLRSGDRPFRVACRSWRRWRCRRRFLVGTLWRIEWLGGPPARATLIRQHSAGMPMVAAREIRLSALLTALCYCSALLLALHTGRAQAQPWRHGIGQVSAKGHGAERAGLDELRRALCSLAG
jgi:hypothetical protein